MKRRTFVASIGTLGAGAAGALGTGAFTSTEADRDVTVTVADDGDAYLELEPASGPNGAYAMTTTDGSLAIDLTSNNETASGGAGLNATATTEIEGVFAIENQGTQTVEVSLSPNFLQDGTDFMAIYPESESDAVVGSSGSGVSTDSIGPVTLDAGNREHYDLYASVVGGSDPMTGTVTVGAESI